jgi:hypothetical protein
LDVSILEFFLALSFIISGELGANPRVRAGRLSVTKFINNICIATRGIGRHNNTAKNNIHISARLTDN